MQQESAFAVSACRSRSWRLLQANLTSKLPPGSIRYTRTSQRLSYAWPKSASLGVTECSHLWGTIW